MTNFTHNSFLCIYFYPLHVSSNLMLIIRRINCVNTTSGVCLSVSVTGSCAGRKGTSELHTKRSPTQNDIYQRLYWYSWFSWWWARGYSKHVENWNKYIENNCVSSWSLTMNQTSYSWFLLCESDAEDDHPWLHWLLNSTVHRFKRLGAVVIGLTQRFPYFLRRGALFRTEIRRGALSSPLNQRHLCAYLAVFT